MIKRVKLAVIGLFSLLVILSSGITFASKHFESASPTIQQNQIDPGFYVQKSQNVVDPRFQVKLGNQVIDQHFYVELNK